LRYSFGILHAYRIFFLRGSINPTGEFIDLHSLADKPVRLPFRMPRKIDTPQSYGGAEEYNRLPLRARFAASSSHKARVF
jgi:hypothetical protein